jgi:predicted 3-demethylubiquinone-9 3-methyltransferase (glyoxalase superfamily)
MGQMVPYTPGNPYCSEGNIMFADFKLLDTWLAAMDSGHQHDFNFNEAISLLIPCEDQKEIDYYWGKLSADPAAEQCGWLKDKYGISWQVWPVQMGEMMKKGNREQIDRVTQAFLPMKKFEISKLKKAYEGK